MKRILPTTTRHNGFVNGPVHVVVPRGADAEPFRETTAKYHQRHYSLAQHVDLRIWTSLFEYLSAKRHGILLHMRHDSSSKIVPTATHAYMHTCTRTCTTSTKWPGNRLGCSGKHLKKISQYRANLRAHAYMHIVSCC